MRAEEEKGGDAASSNWLKRHRWPMEQGLEESQRKKRGMEKAVVVDEQRLRIKE